MNIFSGLYLDPITLNPVNIEPFNPFLVPNIVNIVEPLNVPFMDGVQISGQADKVRKAKEILTNYSKQLVMASKNWKYERKDGKIVLIQKNADGSTRSYNGSGCLLINVDETNNETLDLDNLGIILVRNKTTSKWEDMGGSISDKIQPPSASALVDNARKELMEESRALFLLDTFNTEQFKNNTHPFLPLYVEKEGIYIMYVVFIRLSDSGNLSEQFKKNMQIINGSSSFSNEWKETNDIIHISIDKIGDNIKRGDKDEPVNERTKNILDKLKGYISSGKFKLENDEIIFTEGDNITPIKIKIFNANISCDRVDYPLTSAKLCYADLE